MCNFPSWIKTDTGKYFWLTDKDVERFHDNGTDPINWWDFVGHHGIERIFGVSGEYLEGFLTRCPKKFKNDILSGKCRKIMEMVEIKSIDIQGNKWIIERSDGTKIWYRDGLFHRIDGPAIERSNGTREWYQDGKLHRIDGPSVERFDGTREWYQDGKLHRIDGPAIERSDGTKIWYQDGLLHRIDGPAVECQDGTKIWYRDGLLHRIDGPAIERSNGTRRYWENGKPIARYLIVNKKLEK